MDNQDLDPGQPGQQEAWHFWRLESNEDLKPINSTVPTQFAITNNFGRVLLVYWIDSDGSLEPYIRLNIGECRVQDTWATHSWVVSDERLHTVLVFTSGTKPLEQIVISSESYDAANDKPENTSAIDSGRPPTGFDWLPENWEFLEVDKSTNVVSVSNLCSTSFKIDNTLSQPIRVFWLSFEGEPVLYLTLQAGESEEQSTYATHCWLVKADDGKDLLLFVAGTEQQKYIKVG